MGKDSGAYMEQAQAPTDDGEIFIIEVDGKATPTATEDELQKRRGNRHPKPHACGGARHRGQAKRACRGKKKRRKPGDKSKNGRSITLVVMYTLKRGDDGRLHGPIHKRVRSEEHTSELQSQSNLVCRLLLEKKKKSAS